MARATKTMQLMNHDTAASSYLLLLPTSLFEGFGDPTDTAIPNSSISGHMTLALCIYSATFMRYSLAVTPKNYLLFMCHFINEGSQLTQGYRYLNWHHWGGKEKATSVTEKVKDAVTK
ncbi:hypothetical protein F5Y07DRAFT_313647 [Xylaria sp. FL0933]|nr:hypothetical protein F5Y07DRAFT_313647 [Xylaria sp. FL0933]